MKKILVCIAFLGFHLATKAQVDIELRPNSPNLEVWVKFRNFTSTNDFINGITFTVKWPTTCSGVDLSNSPSGFLPMVSFSTTGTQISGSNNYKIYRGSGSQADYTTSNDVYRKALSIPVSGTAPACPFVIDVAPPVNLGNWLVDGILGNNGSSTMAGLANITSVVLPVEILSFTAEKKNNSVALQFVTVKEQNLKEFVIERSGDGSSFSSIGTILPKAKNENDKVTYDFLDNTPDPGVNYYRIQSRDINGAFKYSQIVSANFGTANSDFKVSPNPAKTGAQLNILTTWAKEYDFKITDMSGRLIFQQLKLHSQNVEINGLDLATGSYIYECKTVNSNSTGKLIITN